MTYNITYTDKWSGEQRTHRFAGTQVQAINASRKFSEEHGCEVTLESVADEPFNNSGKKFFIGKYGKNKESSLSGSEDK